MVSTVVAGQMSGQVVVITGAARGQGEAEARLFAAHGAHVVLCDVLEDAGEALATELGDAEFVRLDVSDAESWQALAAHLKGGVGRVDALVNNAGIMLRAGIQEATVPDFRKVLDVKVLGTVLGMQTCAPLMPAQSAIVNVSSIAAERVIPETAAYTASKWAVKGLTRMAAKEYAAQGIRVNSVQPGVIATEMVRAHSGDEEAVYERHRSRLAVPRLGTSEDIAEAVLFLLSDRAAYITGTELVVDGGWLLG